MTRQTRRLIWLAALSVVLLAIAMMIPSVMHAQVGETGIWCVDGVCRESGSPDWEAVFYLLMLGAGVLSGTWPLIRVWREWT